MQEQSRHPLQSPTPRGVHHLALCTDDMKATIDFYVDVLGMPLVHAMKAAMLRIVATNPSQIVLRYMEWASEGFAHRFTAEDDEIAISNSSS
jgi:catechol 2,3-dioxygenase-like lactoylglutathione lyase family enzyme